MPRNFTKQYYIDYVKLQLTGGVFDLEVSDEVLGRYLDFALVELQRYIDQTKLITVPFAKCIDLTDFDHSAIVHVYRVEGFTGDSAAAVTDSAVDPLYAQQ